MKTVFPKVCLAAIALMCLNSEALAQQPDKNATKEADEDKAAVQQILKMLNERVIEEINFREADIRIVIEHLSQEDARRDPNAKALNFVLLDFHGGKTIKALHLKNVKLIEVLQRVCELTEMRFVVEPY